ncbi:MAG: RNA pyrophosphohydrolase [Alphaproteobacteria bacterium]
MQHLPYRPCVGIMMCNSQGKVFVARRIDMISEAWQMPQGGIDEGEDPLACAHRELMEETGTNKVTLIAQSAKWYHYDLPEDLVPKVWGGRFRGQRQKWFLMQFTGSDADINIETDEPEFSEWRWVEPHDLPAIIVPFKRELYINILEEFRPHLFRA